MPIDLGEFIERNGEAVLSAWETRARSEILPADLTHEQVRDSLALLVEALGAVLRGEGARLIEQGESSLARAHGRERHTVRLPIAAVVREYGILFECIVDLATQHGAKLEVDEVVVLSRAIQVVAAEAVDEFVRKSEESAQADALQHFAFLAHEIRSPLSSVNLTWDIGVRTGEILGSSVERFRRGLFQISECVDRAITQTRLRMLDAGRGIQRDPVAIDEVLQDASEECATHARHKQIELRTEANSQTTVLGDGRMLRSAFTNLVGNAVKFTPNGGTVVLRARVVQNQVLIAIEDGCGGLPPDRAERLFESFVQGNRDRSGFGLGLAIARQAIEAHGGTISVKNRAPEGCTFTIELPFEPGVSPQPPPGGRGAGGS